jgi:hypothetical protein
MYYLNCCKGEVPDGSETNLHRCECPHHYLLSFVLLILKITKENPEPQMLCVNVHGSKPAPER